MVVAGVGRSGGGKWRQQYLNSNKKKKKKEKLSKDHSKLSFLNLKGAKASLSCLHLNICNDLLLGFEILTPLNNVIKFFY